MPTNSPASDLPNLGASFSDHLAKAKAQLQDVFTEQKELALSYGCSDDEAERDADRWITAVARRRLLQNADGQG